MLALVLGVYSADNLSVGGFSWKSYFTDANKIGRLDVQNLADHPLLPVYVQYCAFRVNNRGPTFWCFLS